jgi:hypothetical protein
MDKLINRFYPERSRRETDKPINPVKIPTKPLASRGSSYFNGTEIAFSFTKNPISNLTASLKKECKAISIFNEDPRAKGSGLIN